LAQELPQLPHLSALKLWRAAAAPAVLPQLQLSRCTALQELLLQGTDLLAQALEQLPQSLRCLRLEAVNEAGPVCYAEPGEGGIVCKAPTLFSSAYMDPQKLPPPLQQLVVTQCYELAFDGALLSSMSSLEQLTLEVSTICAPAGQPRLQPLAEGRLPHLTSLALTLRPVVTHEDFVDDDSPIWWGTWTQQDLAGVLAPPQLRVLQLDAPLRLIGPALMPACCKQAGSCRCRTCP
jgi:hypothetical protein